MTIAVEPTFERHLDEAWRERSLLDEVRSGLGGRPRRLSPRWLYDDRGSDLYMQITRLPEYYPTEAERSLLQRVAPDIVDASGADTLIELGSGTSDKTRTLLDAFAAADRLRGFVPLDVSEQTLRSAASSISEAYPGVQVHGVIGDLAEHVGMLPATGAPLVAFLGSTIGNLYPGERAEFLASIASWLPPGGHLLLGVDLVKPVDRIMAAYNDPAGVTAEFTLNLLRVLNHELDGDFDPSGFVHVGLWDPIHDRVDIRLRSTRDQTVHLARAEMSVEFAEDEELRVEISSKFTLEGIGSELAQAGLRVVTQWTSDGDDVALVLAGAA